MPYRVGEIAKKYKNKAIRISKIQGLDDKHGWNYLEEMFRWVYDCGWEDCRMENGFEKDDRPPFMKTN
ncbi:MAG: hypothetical protein KGN01_06510 [Patescibacteria group bacterium]|nr:hypothetical protein [Patescibacteria group bacterium]